MVCPQQQAVAGHNYFGECVLSSYACACVDAQHLLRIIRHHDTACGNASTDWPAATVVNPREVFTSLQGLSGPHVALVIVGTFLFVLTSAFMILTALLVVDRRPDPTGKKNLLSASHGTYNLRNMSAAAYCYHYCSSTQYCSRRLHPIALGHTGTLYTSTHAHAWLLAGRANAMLVSAKIVLCILWTLAGSMSQLNGWGYLVVCVAVGLLYAGAFLRFLPYYHMWLNQMHVAFAAMYLGACVACALALGVDESVNNAGAIVLLMILPIASYVGYAATTIRWKTFDGSGHATATHVGDLTSPFMVDLRVRYVLQDALTTVDVYPTSSLYHSIPSTQTLLQQQEDKSIGESAVHAPLPREVTGFMAGATDPSVTVGSSVSEPMAYGSVAEQQSTRNFQMNGAGDGAHSALVRAVNLARVPKGLERISNALASFVRIVSTPESYGDAARTRLLPKGHPAQRIMDAIYAAASASFASSALLDVMISQYLGSIKLNRHLERVHLRAAEAKADPSSLDVHFFVWQRLHQVRVPVTGVCMYACVCVYVCWVT